MRRTLALLGATALLLTACEAPAVYGPSPTPTVPPIFASEEEAEAAVAEFMDQYVAAFTEMVRSGGDMTGLVPLVSETQLQDEREIIAELDSRGLRLTGEYGYFGLELQQLHQDDAQTAAVQVYVCIDYRGTTYVRQDGTTFEGEKEWAPFEAILTAQRSGSVILEELREWSGRDFCGGG